MNWTWNWTKVKKIINNYAHIIVGVFRVQDEI